VSVKIWGIKKYKY